MIRTDEFRISNRPYAVSLDSFERQVHERQNGDLYYSGQVDAVWFRRRKGLTVACAGGLWDYQDTRPIDVRAFLAAHDDSRYGGDAKARWDGDNLWAPEMSKDDQDRYYELLKSTLDNFPEIPPGFDGWYVFAKDRKKA